MTFCLERSVQINERSNQRVMFTHLCTRREKLAELVETHEHVYFCCEISVTLVCDTRSMPQPAACITLNEDVEEDEEEDEAEDEELATVDTLTSANTALSSSGTHAANVAAAAASVPDEQRDEQEADGVDEPSSSADSTESESASSTSDNLGEMLWRHRLTGPKGCDVAIIVRTSVFIVSARF